MTISLIVGNWKMNTGICEAVDLASVIRQNTPELRALGVVVCPPFVSLAAVGNVLIDSDISVGAQNLYHEGNGPYTGEISAAMLADICRYVIVGHSERRIIFGESDEDVNLKVKASLRSGITPILCVGENLDERNAGVAERVVESQLRIALSDIDPNNGVVVAYEPVWAIGTGQSASPDIAQSMMANIRTTLVEMGGEDVASRVQLLYGGSVNPENIESFVTQPDINGALVGGASLDAEAFVEIVRVVAREAG